MPERLPYSRMSGTVYVMKVIGQRGHRVGVHSTSNSAREGQVRRGVGKEVKIVWWKELSTKAHALAAETLAHLILSHHERWKVVGKRQIQIFDCSQSKAMQSVLKAVRVLDRL